MIASRSLTDGPARARDGRAEPEAPPARPRAPAGRARTSKRRPTVETARGAQSSGHREIGVSRSAVSLTSHVPCRQDRSRSRSRQHAPRTARHAVQRGQRARRRIPRFAFGRIGRMIRPGAGVSRRAATSHVGLCARHAVALTAVCLCGSVRSEPAPNLIQSIQSE